MHSRGGRAPLGRSTRTPRGPSSGTPRLRQRALLQQVEEEKPQGWNSPSASRKPSLTEHDTVFEQASASIEVTDSSMSLDQEVSIDSAPMTRKESRATTQGSKSTEEQSTTGKSEKNSAGPDPDEHMPVNPWCGSCPSQRPYGILALRTEEVNVENLDKLRTVELERKLGMKKPTMTGGLEIGKNVTAAPQRSCIEVFSERMDQTINHPMMFTRAWAKSVEEIELRHAPPKSRFSKDPYIRDHAPAALLRLTEDEVGILERWTIHHVKSQHIQVCAAANAVFFGREGRKQRQAMKYATVCQLLRRLEKGQLPKEEQVFLMEKLEATPFLCDMPKEKIANHVEALKVCSYARGGEVFRHGAVADGVYVLAQGEVELKNEIAGSLEMNLLREAPAVILPEDVVDAKKPFLPRNKDDLFRSRTCVASAAEDSQGVMMLFVPLSVIEDVSTHFRKIEAKARRHLVAGLFSQRMGIMPKIAVRNGDIFEIEEYPQNYVLQQEGSIPSHQTARLMLIVEGKVTLVNPRRGHATAQRKNTKRDMGQFQEFYAGFKMQGRAEAKETAGRGHMLGDAALYGEPYPHSVIVLSETLKVLTLSVSDYLEKLLRRSTVLKRSVVETAEDVGKEDLGVDDISDSGDESAIEQNADTGPKEEKKQNNTNAHAAMMENIAERQKHARLYRDRQGIIAKDWKTLMPRSHLPKKRAPQAAGIRVEDGAAVLDLCYPRDMDLFPKVARVIPIQHRSPTTCSTATPRTGSPSACGSALSAPAYSGLALQALSSKITQSRHTSDRLEAAHRSHTAHGFHIEDAGGASLPLGPLLRAAPRSTVLFRCGAMRGCSPEYKPSCEPSQLEVESRGRRAWSSCR